MRAVLVVAVAVLLSGCVIHERRRSQAQISADEEEGRNTRRAIGAILKGTGDGMTHARQNRSSSNSGGAICPADGLEMWPTGGTSYESGTQLKEVRCSYGHSSWVR